MKTSETQWQTDGCKQCTADSTATNVKGKNTPNTKKISLTSRLNLYKEHKRVCRCLVNERILYLVYTHIEEKK